MSPRVTLLTDFATRDGYVGAMKGVLATLAPDALLDDVGHDVPAGDVWSAAWALGRYWSRYPEGSVHLVVVDPGVGTGRRALAAEADGRLLVAPDNGVLTRVLSRASSWRCVEASDERWVAPRRSSTFHGRDVFAPAAGRLAAGLPLDELGPVVADPVTLEEPEPSRAGGEGRGEVVYVDTFGNLVTNLPGGWLDGVDGVEVGDRWVPPGVTYGAAPAGGLLALVNSDGLIEVALRDGSAAELLKAERGTPVRLLARG
ncbi:MAG: SAM-dependent chlorinase/fluorinase [Gemmatimonadetes bacterium]|nr:SAM-dependent chlorinase/fluorinase [Gemmatimonadota bacterium]